jgi:hypothetical protein
MEDANEEITGRYISELFDHNNGDVDGFLEAIGQIFLKNDGNDDGDDDQTMASSANNDVSLLDEFVLPMRHTDGSSFPGLVAVKRLTTLSGGGGSTFVF